MYELVKDKIKMDHPGSTKRQEEIGKERHPHNDHHHRRELYDKRLETTSNAGQERHNHI
jgi:hypothetical protein